VLLTKILRSATSSLHQPSRTFRPIWPYPRGIGVDVVKEFHRRCALFRVRVEVRRRQLRGSNPTPKSRTIPVSARKLTVCTHGIIPAISSHAFAILVPVRLLLVVVIMILIDARAVHALLFGAPVPYLDHVPQAISGAPGPWRDVPRVLGARNFGETSGR
jgi:hypothetical protein